MQTPFIAAAVYSLQRENTAVNLIQFDGYEYEDKEYNVIGVGSFGKVYRGKRESDGLTVAIKKIPTSNATDIEVDVLLQLMKQPHIVEMLYCHQMGSFQYIVMELCFTDLDKHLALQGGKMHRAEDVKLAAKQLADGYSAIYSKHIMHHDIKLENILMIFNEQDSFILKFGGFGCAEMLFSKYTSNIAGTSEQVAPEIGASLIMGNSAHYDARADIWSLGQVLYQCAVGAPPYDRRALFHMFNVLVLGEQHPDSEFSPMYPPDIPKDLSDLLNEMLAFDYHNRIQPDQLLEHPFISGKPRPQKQPSSKHFHLIH